MPEAVKACREAGIKIAMVTGDHQATAKAIAKQVNIICEERPSADEIVAQLRDKQGIGQDSDHSFFINT